MLVDRVELWHNISMSLGGKLEFKLHDNFIVFKLIISAIPYANSIQPDYPKTKSVKTIVINGLFSQYKVIFLGDLLP